MELSESLHHAALCRGSPSAGREVADCKSLPFVEIVRAAVQMEEATVCEDSPQHDHLASADVHWAAHPQGGCKVDVEDARLA